MHTHRVIKVVSHLLSRDIIQKTLAVSQRSHSFTATQSNGTGTLFTTSSLTLHVFLLPFHQYQLPTTTKLFFCSYFPNNFLRFPFYTIMLHETGWNGNSVSWTDINIHGVISWLTAKTLITCIQFELCVVNEFFVLFLCNLAELVIVIIFV